MGRPQARHPAALLIDQHRRIVAAQGRAHVGGQRPKLVRRLAVALKQDKAEGLGGGEEPPFGVGQNRAGAAEYDSLGRLI